jgi:hypothetical protein
MALRSGNVTLGSISVSTHLVPQGHEVVSKNESLEDDHPFGVSEPLVQQVSQVGDVTSRVGRQVDQV